MEQKNRFKEAYEVNYRIKIEDFSVNNNFAEILYNVQELISKNYKIPGNPNTDGGIIKKFVRYKIEYYYERFHKAYGVDRPLPYPQITSFDVKSGSLLIVFTISFSALIMAKDILDFVEYFNRNLEIDFGEMLHSDTNHNYIFSFYADNGNNPRTEPVVVNGDDRPQRNNNEMPLYMNLRRFLWLNFFIGVLSLCLSIAIISSIISSSADTKEHNDRNKDEIKQWIEERIRDEKINSLFYEQFKPKRNHIEKIDSLQP